MNKTDEQKSDNYLIIGISGCTNSGKTTLTKKLQEKFPSSGYMCQDTYFLEPGDERLEFVEEVNHNNWEKLSAIDMPKLVKDVKNWISENQSSRNPILFVEGFTIFNYIPLSELFHKKYFLTVDFDTCKKRREGRNYVPADPIGYFDKVVWPMYIINKKELEHDDNIVYHCGSQDQNITLQSILKDILQMVGN